MIIYHSESVLMQAYKDPMHAYDHGVAMHIITAIVRTIHKLEIDLGLPQNTLLHKLNARLRIQLLVVELHLPIHFLLLTWLSMSG